MNGAYFSRQPNGAWIRYAIICVMDVESDIELDSYQTLHNVCLPYMCVDSLVRLGLITHRPNKDWPVMW